MAFLHSASGECTKSELDLFTVPPTQTSIENSFFLEVSPLAALAAHAPIEFYVSGSTDLYMDLNDTLLYVCCKITNADGSDIAAAARVAAANYPIATMFSQVDVTLGDRLITQSDNMYAYRAYIETLLNYGNDVMDNQLGAGLFYKDTGNEFDNTTLNGDNTGFVKRARHTGLSRHVDLIGRLHADLFFQDKLLINGVDLKVKLSRNSDAFALMSGDAEQYKLVIISASLFVKRVNISPTVRLAHAEALLLSNAKYPVERVAMKVFSIPLGSRATSQDNLFMGQLPKIIIMGLVETVALSGDYARNPFDFKHAHINYAALQKDGVSIPAKPYTPNFGVPNIVREYMGLVSITGKSNRDSGVALTRMEYNRGYTLMAFDLRPDNASSGHYNLLRSGNLRVDIKFGRPLAATHSLIVWSVFDSVLEINAQRNVLFDT